MNSEAHPRTDDLSQTIGTLMACILKEMIQDKKSWYLN